MPNRLLRQWCAYLENGKGMTVLARDKAHVRELVPSVRSVFEMNCCGRKRADDLP
jgi:hypothetical protein